MRLYNTIPMICFSGRTFRMKDVLSEILKNNLTKENYGAPGNRGAALVGPMPFAIEWQLPV